MNEKYIPSQEELNKADEILGDPENEGLKKMSEEREQSYLEEIKYIDIIEKKMTAGATNAEIENLPEFHQWCKKNGKEPTKRMASKVKGILREKQESKTLEKMEKEKLEQTEKIKKIIIKIENVLDGKQSFLVETKYSEILKSGYIGSSGQRCFDEEDITKGFEIIFKDSLTPKLLYEAKRLRPRTERSHSEEWTNHYNEESAEILKTVPDPKNWRDLYDAPIINSKKDTFTEEQIEDIKKQLRTKLAYLEAKLDS